MRPLLFVLAICLFAPPAQAQSSRGSISAIGGFGKTYDDEGSLGNGWLAGGALDYVLFGQTRVEGSVEILTHAREAGYFQSSGRTLIGAASLVQRFGERTQPYVFGGLTVGHHSGTNTFDSKPLAVNVTNAGYRAGGGVAFRAGDRFEIGPELRWSGFFTSNDAGPVWLPSFAMRAGWRW